MGDVAFEVREVPVQGVQAVAAVTAALAELDIAFDLLFQQRYGSNSQAQGIALLNIVDGYYRTQLNIQFDALSMTFLASDVFDTTTGHLITRWNQDPFSLGSYSYTPVGSKQSQRRQIAMPIENRVFFAGEATSQFFPATVHGAFLSGVRAELGDELRSEIPFTSERVRAGRPAMHGRGLVPHVGDVRILLQERSRRFELRLRQQEVVVTHPVRALGMGKQEIRIGGVPPQQLGRGNMSFLPKGQ